MCACVCVCMLYMWVYVVCLCVYMLYMCVYVVCVFVCVCSIVGAFNVSYTFELQLTVTSHPPTTNISVECVFLMCVIRMNHGLHGCF